MRNVKQVEECRKCGEQVEASWNADDGKFSGDAFFDHCEKKHPESIQKLAPGCWTVPLPKVIGWKHRDGRLELL